MNLRFSICILLLLCFSIIIEAQNSMLFSSIHPLEAPKNHYLELSQLSTAPQDNADLDAISFPSEKFNGYALMTTLAQPAYLTKSQIDFLVNSMKFPANSSEQTRGELDFMLGLQAKRTPEQVERVKYLAKIGYWPDRNLMKTHPKYEHNLKQLLFECQEVIGDQCTIENYPKTLKLLRGIMLDMRIMEFSVKYHLLRPRPYQLESKLEPLQIMGSPSFASGHTLWAYIQAFTYSELIPSKRTEFLDLAYEIGLSREIMGIHYPSDEEAARQLAHRMLGLMWQTEQFQVDFSTAKREWE